MSTAGAFRTPSGPIVPELIKPGDVIKTSYETGPYVVRRVEARPRHWDDGAIQAYDLVLTHCLSPESADQYYPRVNCLIGVDGRVVRAPLHSDDEVFHCEPPPGVPPIQTSLL